MQDISRSHSNARMSQMVIHNETIYLAGQVGNKGDSVADQTRTCLQQVDALLAEVDAATRERIDIQNPMRVQRAWEVERTTGRGLASWQDETPPPLQPLAETTAILFDADKDWLNERIALRFDQMLEQGALDEARENLHDWDPARLSSKAIGAPELIAFLTGKLTKEEACEAATIATRQFAKRQRTWFRARMRGWTPIDPLTL